MNTTQTINPYLTEDNILIYTNILTAGIALISEVLSVSKCGGDKVNGIIQSIIHCGKTLSRQNSPSESVDDMGDII